MELLLFWDVLKVDHIVVLAFFALCLLPLPLTLSLSLLLLFASVLLAAAAGAEAEAGWFLDALFLRLAAGSGALRM